VASASRATLAACVEEIVRSHPNSYTTARTTLKRAQGGDESDRGGDSNNGDDNDDLDDEQVAREVGSSAFAVMAESDDGGE
jgi:hypothetical protein